VARWRSAAVPGWRLFELDRFTRLTTTGNAFLAAISPDGRYVVHIKSEGVRPGLWVRQTATSSDVQIVSPAPVRYDGLTFSPDGNYVYYVTYELSGGVGTLYKIPALGGSPSRVIEDIDSRITFSPDGRQVAFMRGKPAQGRDYLMIANADGSGIRELATLEPPDGFQRNAPSWSPDGRRIVAGGQSLRDGPHFLSFVVDVATGKATSVGGRWAFLQDIEWMPDGGSFVVSAVDFGGQSPQLWQVTYPEGNRRRLTNDLNNYIGVSVSADGRSISTIQAESMSNIWVVPTDAPDRATQITNGRGRGDGLPGLGWTPDARIIFTSSVSGSPQIWIMDADGGNQRQLTNDTTPSMSPVMTRDGHFVIYRKWEQGGMNLRRMALDGSDARALTTSGSAFNPVVGPDPSWVFFYSSVSGKPSPFKVSVEGGDPVALSDTYFQPLDVSPDGKQLLGAGWDVKARRASLATLAVTGGAPATLGLPVTAGASWAPDGRSITYVDVRNDAVNIWMRDPATGNARQLTRFNAENIRGFAWSPDGKRLAVARGWNFSDVVLLNAK
jgi:Tol biopolymer transport system component